MLHVYEYLIKIQQSEKISDILGFKWELLETQITVRLMFNVNLRVILKKSNIITSHE